MALRLTIVSEQCEAAGSQASVVLGNAGGTIGRARDNDWVLADPNCYLSAHHARIQCRLGTYYLLDTSTNGVYVNGGTVPLGRRNVYPLRAGDRVRLGEYLLEVSIEADAEKAPEASAIYPVGSQFKSTSVEVSEPDIGAALDLKDLLRGASASSTGLKAVDAFGQQVLTTDTGLLHFDRDNQSPSKQATPATSPARTRAEPLAAELRAATAARSGRVDGAAGAARVHAQVEPAAVEAFCRGAGIDAAPLSGEAPARLLHRAGLLLREALGGLKGLALAQRELRDRSHIKLERDTDTAPQPDLTALAVEELLLQLLSAQQHELDTVQWLRDSAGSMREHELAFMRALHAALAEFITRLDPRTLSQGGTERTEEPERTGSGLTARFRSITDMSSGLLPQLFVEALARAFAAEYVRSAHPHSDA